MKYTTIAQFLTSSLAIPDLRNDFISIKQNQILLGFDTDPFIIMGGEVYGDEGKLT